MLVYLKVSKDKYKFIEALADTPTMLADMCELNSRTVCQTFSRIRNGKLVSDSYEIVEIEDEGMKTLKDEVLEDYNNGDNVWEIAKRHRLRIQQVQSYLIEEGINSAKIPEKISYSDNFALKWRATVKLFKGVPKLDEIYLVPAKEDKCHADNGRLDEECKQDSKK